MSMFRDIVVTLFQPVISKIEIYVAANNRDSTYVWLSIRFKMIASFTWVFLPVILVYIGYVLAFIPYIDLYVYNHFYRVYTRI